MNSFLKKFQNNYATNTTEMSFEDYLELCKTDSSVYASAAERLLKVIGEPKTVDTQQDPILSRIFSNRKVKLYDCFSDFYGLEDVIENLVNYIKFNAQNLEESKSILYLLGPVGSGKSSLVEKLKELMESAPLYVIKDSPVFDNPLSVFWGTSYIKELESKYKIPPFVIKTCPSPWLIQKLKDMDGDVMKLRVEKVYPSRLNQVCISKVEPGDENNADISTLVGKVDIRQLESYAQNHPYAYSYSGGLCRGNRGIVDIVEIFKAPLKMLNPLLTATQERNYNGTETIGSLPFEGLICAHSNEQEWQTFKNNRTNEAFIDRITLVKVPYSLRSNEEVHIYEKLLNNSTLKDAPRAPWTLDLLAKFCVLSRLYDTKIGVLYSKLRVYDGENIKDTDPRAKPIQEFRDEAGVTEGMTGISTRFGYKVLSKTYNFDHMEIAANPVHLMHLLKLEIMKEQFPKDVETKYLGFIDGVLHEKYLEILERQIRTALMKSHDEYSQNLFEKYVLWADHWLSDNDYRDETGLIYDKSALNDELEKVEKAGLEISNPKEFRSELVSFVLRHRANHNGELPKWNIYAKMRDVIEKNVLDSTETLLPIISFSPKSSEKEKTRHKDYLAAMKEIGGYTERQTRLVTEWFMRVRKSS